MLKKISLFFIIFSFIFCISCGEKIDNDQGENDDPVVIEFTTNKLILNDAAKIELPITDKTAEVIVEDESVCYVEDGNINAANAGFTRITLKNNPSEVLEVIVNPFISIKNELVVGKTYLIEIKNYNKEISDFIFTSSNNEVIIINSDNTITAVGKGDAFIIATLKENPQVTNKINLVVSQETAIISTSLNKIYVDDVFDLNVTNYNDKFIFSTATPDIIEIIGNSVFALRDGTAIIEAVSTVDSNIKGIIEVKIFPLNPKIRLASNIIKIGDVINTSILNYENKDDFIWTSSDTSVIAIDDNNNLVANKEGQAVITIISKIDATLMDNINVEVYGLMPILSCASSVVEKGKSVKIDILNYINKEDFTWKVVDENVVFLVNYLAQGLSAGKTTIVVTSKKDSSLTSSINIEVIPVLPILETTYTNMRVNDIGYLWIKNSDKVEGKLLEDFNITLSNDCVKIENDVITAVKEGTSIITITLKTNPIVTANTTINITKTSLNKDENGEINDGVLLLYTNETGGRIHAGEMTHVYIDSAKNLGNYNWVTSNSLVATINDEGRLIAISSGIVSITAVSKTNKEVKGTITLNIYGEPNVDYVTRLISIAEEELGYVEGPNNDTKYGAWYNLNYEAWCAMFVSWCCYEAGISTKIVPRYCGCTAGMAWFVNNNCFGARGEYTPKPGDIAFYRDADQTTGSTHTGIVVKVDANRVYTIEGNTSDMVARRSYALTSSYIVGYGIPNYPEFVKNN